MHNYKYRCLITGYCSATAVTSNEATLTLNSLVSISAHPAASTKCQGENTSFSVTASGSGISYQWQVSTNGGSSFSNLSNVAPYSNVTTATLNITNTPASLNGYIYRCYVNGTCSPLYSNNALYTVNAAPAITNQPDDLTVGEYGSAIFSVAATGAGLSYQWYESPDGTTFSLLDNGGNYSNVNTFGVSISSLTIGSFDGKKYRCVVSGTCSPAATSDIATLTVTNAPAITTHPIDKSICVNSATSFKAIVTGTSGLSFVWEISTNGGAAYNPLTIAAPYSVNNIVNGGNTESELSISSVSSGMNSYRYRCAITNAVPQTSTSNAGILTTKSTGISQQPVDKNICANSNVTFVTIGSGDNLTYQWQVNTGSGFEDVTNSGKYSGATLNILDITNAPQSFNGYKYRCVVTGDCAPAVNTNEVNLAVNTAPVISTQPTDKLVCESSNTTLSVVSPDANTIQWQVNPNTGSFTDLSNTGIYSDVDQADLIITGVTNDINVYSYRAVLENSCGSITSNEIDITVSRKPKINNKLLQLNVCENDAAELSVSAIGKDSTFQWQVDQGAGFANITEGSGYTGTQNDTLKISNMLSGMNGNKYRLVLSGACSPDAISDTSTVVLKLLPQVNTQAKDAAVCLGNDTSFTIAASGAGTLTYQWQIDPATGSFGDLSEGGIYSDVNSNVLQLVNPGAELNNYRYRCVVTGECSTPTIGNPATLTIRELPEPIISQSGSLFKCVDDSIKLETTQTFSSYKWSNDSTKAFIYVTDSNSYSVEVVDMYGCEGASSATTINESVIPNPEICIVTVDSDSEKNLVTWNKTEGFEIDYYNIYRQTDISGVYEKLDTVNYETLSIYLDETSQPENFIYRYKISAVDNCGNETNQSPFHQTILLQWTGNEALQQIQFNWSRYIVEGKDPDVYPFTTYQILRGNDSITLLPILNVAATFDMVNFDDTDNIAKNFRQFYRIAGLLPNDLICNPKLLKIKEGPYSSSVSNLEDNRLKTTVGFKSITNNITGVYPNPARNYASLVLELQETAKVEASIYSLIGSKIADIVKQEYTSGSYSETIDIRSLNLKQGMYIIKVSINGNTTELKMAVE